MRPPQDPGFFFSSPVQLIPKESRCLAHTPKFMAAVQSILLRGIFLICAPAIVHYAFIYQGTFETPQM